MVVHSTSGNGDVYTRPAFAGELFGASTLFGIAAFILALGFAFYFERQSPKQPSRPADGIKIIRFVA
jgi:hypothetical protein